MKNARSGFTLVEMMLAVALTAAIMAIIYGIVVSTVQAQQRVEELDAGTEIGPALLSLIRRDLDAVFLPDTDKENFVGQDRRGPTGDRDRIDFVAAVTAFGSDDPYADPRLHTVNEIGYSVGDSKEHSGEGVLYRREDYWVDADPLKGGVLTDLYDRVTLFRLEYSDGREWVHEWTTKNRNGQLPAAIRVTMKLKIPDKTAEGGVVERTFALTVSRPE